MNQSIAQELVASVHGIYRGGLGVHLALMAMGGGLGLTVNLEKVPCDAVDFADQILFSESAGRFIVTVRPENCERFERLFEASALACIGRVTDDRELIIDGLQNENLVAIGLEELKEAWKRPFGHLI